MLSKLPIQSPLTLKLISLTQLEVGQINALGLLSLPPIQRQNCWPVLKGVYFGLGGFRLCTDSRWSAGKVLAQNKGGSRLVNDCSVSSRLRTRWVPTSRYEVCMALSAYTVSGTSRYCDRVRVRDRVGGHLPCSPLLFPLEQSHEDILNGFNQVTVINIWAGVRPTFLHFNIINDANAFQCGSL